MTISKPAKGRIDSQYGAMSYESWLIMEQMRLRAEGAESQVRADSQGVALWTTNPGNLETKAMQIAKGYKSFYAAGKN